MRRDEKAVDLLVRVIGEREHDPVRTRAQFARLHRDAADDAVPSGGGGDADLIAIRAVALDHRGEIDGLGLEVHTHSLDGPSVSRPGKAYESRQKRGYGERNDPQRFGLSSDT